MKKVFYVAAVAALASVCFLSCGKQSKSDASNTESETAIDAAHNSRNSLDWKGTYVGMIPCASCEGIEVQFVLKDSSYVIDYTYLGKKKESHYQSSGKFTWDESGSVITLDDKDMPPYYKVGEDRLIQLDMDGKEITGQHAEMYVLKKKIEGDSNAK